VSGVIAMPLAATPAYHRARSRHRDDLVRVLTQAMAAQWNTAAFTLAAGARIANFAKSSPSGRDRALRGDDPRRNRIASSTAFDLNLAKTNGVAGWV